jgi:cytochrome c biogenesis protein
MKFFNQLWDFFASVKLAIFTLCALAFSSIAGTIVPQGEVQGFYVQRYGEKIAAFIHVLDIDTMYSSWWFVSLLLLLCANLIVCSVDRFPAVWRIVTSDNRAISLAKIEGMSLHRRWPLAGHGADSLDLAAILRSCGWPKVTGTTDGNIAFSQKGKWSRTGVYVVHFSILVIFLGAFIGMLYGEKGSVMLPELQATDKVFRQKDSSPVELGFTVRCDSFGIEFYPNGMPKEYKSRLTIIDQNREVLTKDIEVNSPLQYRGYTFYQSSYQGFKDFIINIGAQKGQESHKTVAPFQKQLEWHEKNLHFGIINAEAVNQQVTRAKLWIKANNEAAQTQWLKDQETASFTFGDNTYEVMVKQMYATGLQVAKDPGVYVVYLGCGLMLLGLYMAFFMSHRRVWLYRQEQEDAATLHLAGSTNKNKMAFNAIFQKIEERINLQLKS